MRAALFSVLFAVPATMAGLISRTSVEPASPVVDIEARELQPTTLTDVDFDPKPSSLPFMTPPTGPAAPVQKSGGVLTCHAATITKDLPAFYMTRNEAAIAVSTFCNGIQPGVIFKPVGGTPFQYSRNEGPYTYITQLSAVWTGGSNMDCPTLDFSIGNSSSICQTNLLTNIVDSCNTEENGLQFWKAGGTFETECMTWNIQRYFLPPN